MEVLAAWSERPVARGEAGVEVGEEDPDLALGAVRGVGAVHDVLGDHGGEVAADRARGGVVRVRRAHQGAHPGDRGLPGYAHGHQGTGGDEVDQFGEERLVDVLGVMVLGHGAGQRAQFDRFDDVALAFDAADDLADQAASNAVRLDQYECLLNGHGKLLGSGSRVRTFRRPAAGTGRARRRP
jgi:hypothetical protein